MGTKQVFALRFDPGLMARVDSYARDNGWADHHRDSGARGGDHKGRDTGRTALVTSLLEALVEGRVAIQPRAGANPFPAEETVAGESPEHPITITAPAQPKGWFIREVQGVGVYNTGHCTDPCDEISLNLKPKD